MTFFFLSLDHSSSISSLAHWAENIRYYSIQLKSVVLTNCFCAPSHIHTHSLSAVDTDTSIPHTDIVEMNFFVFFYGNAQRRMFVLEHTSINYSNMYSHLYAWLCVWVWITNLYQNSPVSRKRQKQGCREREKERSRKKKVKRPLCY